jgi:2-oxo-3-hexenedioate decarboxylase/2-keto-4-pentenoate hydratase
MSPEAIAEAIAIFERTRLMAEGAEKIPNLPDSCRPKDLAECYALQHALNERLAGALGPIAGQKIGCTSKVMQDYMSIDQPCSGGIYANTITHLHRKARHSEFWGPGVECEIAVRLSSGLTPERAPFTVEQVAEAVDSCMAAIEIVDNRYVDYRTLDLPTMVADDFFNAGCVLASPVVGWRELDIGALRGVMTINGAEVGAGYGRDVMGHPFEVVAWLANSRAERGLGLKAGEIVMTGSVVETVWCEPGDDVRATIEALGEARITFAP